MGALACMGVGARVGAAVDAAIPGRRQVVYRAPPACPAVRASRSGR